MSYVLAVDDEEGIRIVLSRLLKEWGYRVKTASTATEALELMLAEPAAIALIDIRMPGRDGLWLIERVREKWSATAVVVITGVGEMEIIEHRKKLGVVDYVLKPFGREVLRQALERAANNTNC